MNELLLALCAAMPALGMSNYRTEKACEYTPQIIKSSKKHQIDPEVMIGLIFVESSFSKKVVSSAGACGLTQIMPKYTGKITRKYSCDYLKRNPLESIDAGAKILRWWIDYHHEKNQSSKAKEKKSDAEVFKRALCSYNAGFRCSGKRPSKGGMRYSRKVLRKANIIKEKKNLYLSD